MNTLASSIQAYQQSLYVEARDARDDGIARADEHADVDWKQEARGAVLWCARRHPVFTADEVWERLEAAADSSTHEPAALGPIFLWAARHGFIEKTGATRPTKFQRRHRDLTLWRSTLVSGPQ